VPVIKTIQPKSTIFCGGLSRFPTVVLEDALCKNQFSQGEWKKLAIKYQMEYHWTRFFQTSN